MTRPIRTRTPQTLVVTAAHTNDTCQVFVRVQSIDGLTLAQASLLGSLPQPLSRAGGGRGAVLRHRRRRSVR